MRVHVFRLSAISLFAVALTAPALAQAPPTDQPPPKFKVEVIESTPLPGVNLTLEDIPAPVQTALARDIEASGALDLSDFLNRRINGVFVNEMQGNPFQADVNYRGYTASPLLGTPQGISVYMDGVRLNQPFGDVVSWDLIPRIAIGSTTLMPGSNPLFGLNTLGGALSIQTKDGRSAPGTSVRGIAGTGTRRSVEFEHGGSRGAALDWYVAGNFFAEDGWREASPSTVNQLFGKLAWHNPKTDVAVSAAYADTALTGNGLQEQRFLAEDYASVYSIPDTTDNRATLVNVTATHKTSASLTVTGNAYYRDIHTSTLNGDVNDDSLDQSLYQPTAAERAALTAAGYSGFPASGATAANTPFPYWRCIGQVLLNDEPAEKCDGLLNRTATQQQNYGASGQLTRRARANGRRNQFTLGGGYDGSRVAFQQSTQLGYLNPDRTITAVNGFADGGVTGGNVDGVPYDNRVDLNGHVNTGSVYAADVLSIGSAWHLSASGRYNRTAIQNSDQIRPAGGTGSLNGDYVFGRLNPAAGVTFSPSSQLNLYTGYSEGSRAPTSIELGCADPNAPCKLPNALAGDPPLDQVVTRTWEAGARGGWGAVNWNAGVFHANNLNDILFVSSTQTGFGYFKNFGATRREGIELGINVHKGRVSGGAGYTYLSATYQSTETVDGAGNSTNALALIGAKGLDGTITIQPGDRIPLIPNQLFKMFGDVALATRLSVDVAVISASSSYARGNENNLHQPDGVYYLGPGSSPAYAVVNAGAHYDLTKMLQLVAQLNNVFDTHYYTASQITNTAFSSTGGVSARGFPAVNGDFPIQQATFYAPGAPRTFWAGLKLKV